MEVKDEELAVLVDHLRDLESRSRVVQDEVIELTCDILLVRKKLENLQLPWD